MCFTKVVICGKIQVPWWSEYICASLCIVTSLLNELRSHVNDAKHLFFAKTGKQMWLLNEEQWTFSKSKALASADSISTHSSQI